MGKLGIGAAIEKIKRRIRRLEKQIVNEVEDIKAIKDAVEVHNAADVQFQTEVNNKVAFLEAAVKASDMTAIDQGLTDLKASIAAQPSLTLPA